MSILIFCISSLSCFLHCHKISLPPFFVLWSPPSFLIYCFLLASLTLRWLSYYPWDSTQFVDSFTSFPVISVGILHGWVFVLFLFFSLLVSLGIYSVLYSVTTFIWITYNFIFNLSFHSSYPIFPPGQLLVSKTVKMTSCIFSALTNHMSSVPVLL